jgi:hypothetical protein
MNSVEARIGLWHTFNQAKLNQVAWAGKGRAYGNPLLTTAYGVPPVNDEYNLALASKLFKQAGVTGQEVDLSVLNGSPNQLLEAQILVDAFTSAGLKAKVIPRDPNTWAHAVQGRTMEGVYNNYSAGLASPIQEMMVYLLDPYIFPNPPQYPKTPVPEMVNAFNAAVAAVTPAQVSSTLTHAQHVMFAQVPIINTFTVPLAEVVPKNLQQLESTEFGDVRFDAAYLA